MCSAQEDQDNSSAELPSGALEMCRNQSWTAAALETKRVMHFRGRTEASLFRSQHNSVAVLRFLKTVRAISDRFVAGNVLAASAERLSAPLKRSRSAQRDTATLRPLLSARSGRPRA
jgi:hypothetical protein